VLFTLCPFELTTNASTGPGGSPEINGTHICSPTVSETGAVLPRQMDRRDQELLDKQMRRLIDYIRRSVGVSNFNQPPVFGYRRCNHALEVGFVVSNISRFCRRIFLLMFLSSYVALVK
jgi:hypothetical protein